MDLIFFTDVEVAFSDNLQPTPFVTVNSDGHYAQYIHRLNSFWKQFFDEKC